MFIITDIIKKTGGMGKYEKETSKNAIIFEYIEDIEETYKFLMGEAKKENFNDIIIYEKEQRETMIKVLQEKQKILEDTLKIFKETMEKDMRTFEKNVSNSFFKIRKNFRKKRRNLIELVLENLGFEFIK